MSVRVIIAAAGSGTRFGHEVPKQFLELGGKSILWHTVGCFESCDIVEEIAIVVPSSFASISDMGFSKVKHVVAGKNTRAESVYEGLKRISLTGISNETVVLVHDGVRPFVSLEAIENVAQEAKRHGAAIAATKVTDTIKQVDSDGFIGSTISRENLWRAATPQGFRMGILHDSFNKAAKHGYLELATDEAYLAENAGFPVFIVEGNPENIKITNPADMVIAKEWIRKTKYEIVS